MKRDSELKRVGETALLVNGAMLIQVCTTESECGAPQAIDPMIKPSDSDGSGCSVFVDL